MSSNQTQTDHLIGMIAPSCFACSDWQAHSSEDHTPTRTGSASFSASISAPTSVCILTIKRVGNRCRRPCGNHGDNSRTIASQSSEVQESSDEPLVTTSWSTKDDGPLREQATLVKDLESPFAEHIQTCHVPERFKLPTLESYDGSTNPVDH